MNKFYTSSGDDGCTGLMKAGRVPKNDEIIEALGTIDEANAALGVARSICAAEQSSRLIIALQRDLYQVMGEVAAAPENAEKFRSIDAHRVSWLEEQIELINSEVQIPKDFIVPGDTLSAACLDVARTVVRRAERRIAGLIHNGVIENRELLRYLNQLSSLCFALEVLEIQKSSKNNPTFARQDL